MIFQGVTRPDTAGLGVARPGEARPYVTQYGNWDNFSRLRWAVRGMAGPGAARQGNTPAGGRYHRTLSVNKNKATKATT